MAHRTESFTHDGHRLVYDSYGDGERVVVYLHGLLLDAELNRGIAGALASQGYRVLLLDLLGHGRSDKPTHAAEYRIDAYADQVFALLDELGIGRAVLGGLSLGANVSLFAAAQRPERVAGLVLEMPVLERAVPSAAMSFVPLLLAVHYARSPLALLSALVERVPRTPFGPLNAVLDAMSTSPEVVSAVLHGVLVGPVVPTREARRAIDVPALVLAHTYDLIHPFDDAVRLSAVLPRGRLVRAHSPLELRLRPRRLTEAVSEFLAEIDRPVGSRPSTMTSVERPDRTAAGGPAHPSWGRQRQAGP